jgi:rare lipoprotein A
MTAGLLQSDPSRLLRAVLVLGALVAACAHPATRRAGIPPEEERAPRREEGLASFYARALEGRRTASGGRYDGREMTCAHPSHAFGTLLRVTDVENGKSVVVKVTDRGPFARGRVVDLSWAAARALGMLERGVARVVVEVVGPGG